MEIEAHSPLETHDPETHLGIPTLKNKQSGTAGRRRRRQLSNSDSAAATSGAFPGSAAKRKRTSISSQVRVSGDTAAEAARRQLGRQRCDSVFFGGRRRLQQNVVVVDLFSLDLFLRLLFFVGGRGPSRGAQRATHVLPRRGQQRGSSFFTAERREREQHQRGRKRRERRKHLRGRRRVCAAEKDARARRGQEEGRWRCWRQE